MGDAEIRQKRLREAQKAHERGWLLTPLCGKVPTKRGWTKAPPPSTAVLVRWARDGNLGLRTGRVSGVVVVDDDTPDGSGAAALNLPATVSVTTASGKRHYYFRAPAGGLVNSVSKIAAGVDVRGDGGQVVYPGSIHPDTKEPYVWTPGLSPEEIALAEFPEHLLPRAASGSSSQPRRAGARGRRSAGRQAAAVCLLQQEVDKLVSTPPGGGRNDTLNRAAFLAGRLIGSGALHREQAESMLREPASRSGLEPGEIEATLRSGLDAGEKRPWVWNAGSTRTGAGPDKAGAERSEPPESPRSSQFVQGDDNDLADAFVADHGENVRYCAEDGRWLLWDGKRWRRDDSLRVEGQARASLETVAVAARKRAEELAHDKDVAKKLRTFAQRARSPQGVRIALQGAAGSGKTAAGSRLCLPRTDFDAVERTRYLLNVENGVLDPRSGKLTSHEDSKGLLLTKLAPVAYRPEAHCPGFLQALDRIFESDTKTRERADRLIELLQLGLGYSLLGDQRHHLVFLLYGPEGRNGKSMVIRIVLRVLGRDYAQMAAPGLLKKKPVESHPTEVADLYGARFVAATETARGEVFNEAVLKHLTGGDRLKARRMHQDFSEFEPTHHLWIASNFLPRADAMDEAFWARVRVIPFERRFLLPGDEGYADAPEEARAILDLEEQVLAEEREGVFAWAVEGCKTYWETKIIPAPPEACVALEEYRRSNDPLVDWMEERCEVASKLDGRPGEAEIGWTPIQLLYEDFVAWSTTAGVNRLSNVCFARALSAKGVMERKRGGVRGRLGIGLREVRG